VKTLRIKVDASDDVSGLLILPPRALACFVFAHGAGAGMTHPFMEAVASGLEERRIATLRYQFSYMEKGTRRPDPPAKAHAAVRAAVAKAAKLCSELPIIAGGKSFGGRMTSQAQAIDPIPEVRGLAFFGFPLHPSGKPSDLRAQHLFEIKVPMLILQGERDTLAEMTLLVPMVGSLGDRATLRVFKNADHSFHVPVRSGRTDREVKHEMLNFFTQWVENEIISRGR
jgi:predicted alpha/beta-hydrolase family hydrolase